MKQLPLFSIFFIFSIFTSLAQVSSIKEAFLPKLTSSDLIFSGKVINKSSFWNENKSKIFTRNNILVNHVIKGNIQNQDIVEVITQGGVINNIFQTISHSINYVIDDENIFFCKFFPIPDFSTERSEIILMPDGENSLISSSDLLLEYFSKGLNFGREININIEFRLDVLKVTNQSIQFNILAKANNPVKLSSGFFLINYSPNTFGDSIVSNQGVEISNSLFLQNNRYTTILSDFSANTLKYEIQSNCIDGSDFSDLSIEFQNICTVSLNISNISEIGEISFNEFGMDGSFNFWINCSNLETNSDCCLPFDEIIYPNKITTRDKCQIISHTHVTTAGTGDLLTISGVGFGAETGQVIFPNADDGGLTTMHTLPPDLTWSDNKITVRVPSIETSNKPAGSGYFTVAPVNADTCRSPEYLEIRYAVANFRVSQVGTKIHMGDLKNESKYRWLVDSKIKNNIDALHTVRQSICDWNSSTSVNWNYIGESSTNKPTLDTQNVVYLSSSSLFYGGSAGATAYTTTTGERIQSCFDGTNLSAYYLDLDIVIRDDVTKFDNDTCKNCSWNYSIYSMPDTAQFDFYSVVLHEMGHAHHLKHAIDDSKIMYYQLKKGQTRRSINFNDADGGADVLSASSSVLSSNNNCPMPVGKSSTCSTTAINSIIHPDYHIGINPNPLIDNSFRISFDQSNDRNSNNLIIYDILGSRIIGFNNIKNNDEILLPQNCSKGIYFLVFRLKNNTVVKKIIKN